MAKMVHLSSNFFLNLQGDRDVETFDVELVKDSRGLGITIAGYVEQSSGLFELLKLSNIMKEPLCVKLLDGIVLFCICSDIDVDHNNYLSLPLAELSGIFVKSIADGSAASVDGKLRINDQIIEVQTNSHFTYV